MTNEAVSPQPAPGTVRRTSPTAAPTATRMPGPLSASPTPSRAARFTPPRWLDARLLLGLLLVLGSVVAGARVFASADHYSRVYVAARDLVPGEHLTAADLTVGQARLHGQGGYYVAAGATPPVGYVVRRFVGAHELVPLNALAPTTAAADTRLVTVPVQPGHLPADLGRGDLVDVYVTPKTSAGGAVATPTLVLAGAAVEDRQGGARTFSADATLAVVLDVPAGDVVAVVHAVESGAIDLVRVPHADAQSAPAPAEP